MRRSGAAPETSIELVAGGEGADGAYAVLEVRAPQGTTLPPHVTTREDGLLLLLEGRLEVVLDGERRELGPGQALSVPHDRPRRACVLEDVRLLCLSVPAGLERLAGVLAEPDLDPDDRAALLAVAGVALLPVGWGAASR